MSETQDLKRAKVSIGKTNFLTNVKIRSHEISLDEPKEQGGQDEGPTPGELLLASLGSCQVITMKMYADRKGWEIEGIDIELELEREVDRGEMTTFIRQSINIRGELDPDQRSRLLSIAKKCPIHRTLTSPIVINSEAG